MFVPELINSELPLHYSQLYLLQNKCCVTTWGSVDVRFQQKREGRRVVHHEDS